VPWVQLLVSTDAVSCYPASMVNFIWFTDKKCLSYQHYATWGHIIRHFAIQKLNHLASGVCWCLAGKRKSQAIPSGVWKWSFWAFFCPAMVKLQQFVISKPDEVHHRRRAAIQQLSAFGYDKQVCTHGTLWRHHMGQPATGTDRQGCKRFIKSGD